MGIRNAPGRRPSKGGVNVIVRRDEMVASETHRWAARAVQALCFKALAEVRRQQSVSRLGYSESTRRGGQPGTY